MNLPLSASLVVLIAAFGNRILAVLAGLWFRVPDGLLLPLLIGIDVIQIPMFYWLYEHGSFVTDRLPEVVRKRLQRDPSVSYTGRWGAHLGGFGVMMVAALPTFGGGMLPGTMIAYGLGLRRRASYAWLILGSVLSYFTLYWVLDTIVRTVRYFAH